MNSRINPVFIVAALVLIFGAVGCQSGPNIVPADDLSPEKKTAIIESAIAWLECEECDDKELERLKEHGESAVPTLTAALKQGPSPASRELMRLQMEKRYDRLMEYGKTHPKAKIRQSKEQFVSQYMDNYVSLYRTRAVKGLSAIGGENALKAINEAAHETYREDVNRVIKETVKER